MSLFARRMFMAQNVKIAVAGWEITFTVKEWFLDPDNSFTDTEVGALQYMTVKIGSETKQTDANGQVVFTLPDGSYTYEVYDNARYLTTYRDDITVSGATQSISVKCYACLYKPTDVWDMINNDSYVPVASGAELDSLRNTGSRTMGANTIFVGSYATGRDKYYVQVGNCNLSGYVNWNPIGVATPNNFIGIYKGNLLSIINLYSTANFASIFGVSSSLISDLYIHGEVSSTSAYCGLLCAYISILNANSLISNVKGYGVVNSTNILVGGLIGVNYDYSGSIYSGINILNCEFNGTVSGRDYVGGICGYSRGASSLVEDCITDSIVSGTGRMIGNICGWNYGSIIRSCSSTGSVTSSSNSINSNVGGICGVNSNAGLIELCHSSSNCSSTGTAPYNVGGLVGANDTSTSIIRNSYATGSATSGSTHAGGLVGRQFAGSIVNCYAIGAVSGTTSLGGLVGQKAGTITNSYYDSQTTGMSDTGKGLPRTTAQMQTGTANSYILPDGTTDPDSLPVNAMYLNWDGNIWEFGTASEYPTLK